MNKFYLLIPLVFLAFIIPLVLSQSQDCRTDQDCIDKDLLNHSCNQTTGLCQPRQDAQQSPGNYIVVPPTETPEPTYTQPPVTIPTEQDCTESDNGKNYYVKGSSTIPIGSNVITNYTDFCFLNTSIRDKEIFTNTLNEYYCENNILKSEEYDCSSENKICKDGKCATKEEAGTLEFNVYEGIFEEGGKYYRGLDKELNKESYFVDRTVADQDPLECKFATGEQIDLTQISFRVYDDFKNSVQLEPTPLNCRGTECKVVVEPFTFPRGIERSYGYEDLNPFTSNPLKLPKTNSVKCEVTYKNNIYTSESLNIANHLYIFIPSYPPYPTNLQDQYQYYIDRTYLDEKSAKAIYLSDQKHCGYSLEELEEEAEEIIAKMNLENSTFFIGNFMDVFARNCLIRLGNKWKSEFDFVITLMNLSKSHFNPNIKDVISLDGDSSNKATIAHELGHAISRLRDEYILNSRLSRILEFFAEEKKDQAINSYPSCCIDSEDNPYVEKFNWVYTVITEGVFSTSLIIVNENGVRGYEYCEYIGGICREPNEGVNYLNKDNCPKEDEYEVLQEEDDLAQICPKKWGSAAMAACCFTKEKLANSRNNCFPPGTVPPKRLGVCAGHPLNQDGSKTSNLEIPFRSIMGYHLYPSEYKIYPQGVSYPLKPGIPKVS